MRDTLSRYRVVKRLSAIFDIVLAPLGLAGLALLIVELLLRLAEPWSTLIYFAQVAIWVVFLAAFVLELALAPKRTLYLRRNWYLLIALAVPALRMLRFSSSLRFLRSAKAVRSTTLLRGFTSLRSGVAGIRSFLGFSQFALLTVLTGAVWLAAAGLVYYFEAGTGSGIDSVGDALWWGAAVLTTVGISSDPMSLEGRVVAIVLRVFSVAIIGYFTARLAAFFFGGLRERTSNDAGDLQALRQEIAGLREELKLLRAQDQD